MYSIARCISSINPEFAKENEWYIIVEDTYGYYMFISEKNTGLHLENYTPTSYIRNLKSFDYLFDLDNMISVGDKVFANDTDETNYYSGTFLGLTNQTSDYKFIVQKDKPVCVGDPFINVFRYIRKIKENKCQE